MSLILDSMAAISRNKVIESCEEEILCAGKAVKQQLLIRRYK